MTTIHPTDADFARVTNRRRVLMAARQDAIARKDRHALNEITMRLAKLPTPTVGRGNR